MTESDLGIAGVGAYAPRYRIDADAVAAAWDRFEASGVREKAVPGPGEDALTMGTAAAERALAAAGVAGEAVSLIAFATTTPPLAEEDPTPRLGEFLGVPAAADRRYLTGSTRAGVAALAAGFEAGARAGAASDSTAGTGTETETDAESGAGPALVVAADRPRGEPDSTEDHAAGAGAAAFVLTADGSVRLWGRGSYAADYPGTRYRRSDSDRIEGLGITAYDREAYAETVAGAVADLGADDATAGDIDADAVALQAPDGKLPYRAAGALGVETDDVAAGTTVHDLGDTGAASVPLGLARSLAAGRERTLAVGQGSGAGADALLLVADDACAPPVASNVALGGDDSEAEAEGEGTSTPTEAVDYATYLRLRGEITGSSPAGGGAKVSVPSWRRTRGARYRLDAGRCPDCGALAFPAEGACPDCHALVEYETVRLAREGRVETATTVSPGGAPPEFAQQGARGGEFAVTVVAFPPADAEAGADGDGSTASVPMQTVDADPESVAAGDRVRAVVRRVYEEEGVPRYGRKVRPASKGSESRRPTD